MDEQKISEIEERIFEYLKDKIKNTYSKETEKIIVTEVKNKGYLTKDWQVWAASQRIKEKIDKYLKDQIKPLTFKEEMKNPISKIIFTITTLIVVLSGVVVFLYLAGMIQTSERILPIFLFIFIGGVSFVIKQIIEGRKQNKKYERKN